MSGLVRLGVIQAVWAALALAAAPSFAAAPSDPADRARQYEAWAQSHAPEDIWDAPFAPRMQVIPPGEFAMGWPAGKRPIAIRRAFAVSRYLVTFDEWDACVDAGGCGRYSPGDGGWGRGARPVINVHWNDARAYVQWLSRKTGQRYRLLSEAEYEYAARAGTTTLYWWGDDVGRGHANCDGCGSQWDNDRSSPAGSFAPNAFGLYDTAGNVWSWTADCWNDELGPSSAKDGGAVTHGICGQRVIRGGSWNFIPKSVQSGLRNWYWIGNRSIDTGFRVAREL